MSETDTTTEPTEPGTALARQEPTAAPVQQSLADGMPTEREWQQIETMANVLATSDLVPTAYRRKPANIILASLAGRPFRWDPTMAMRSFHIIEGVPSMKPEVMLALIRQAGHSVTGDVSNTSATVRGVRRDTGDEMAFTYTMDDARRAGLHTKAVWKSYPASMLWARALSQLARMLFPDVVLGSGYTPEELDARLADDDVIDLHDVDGVHVEVATVNERQVKNRLVAYFDGDAVVALKAWNDRPEFLVSADADAKFPLDAVEEWVTSLPVPAAQPAQDAGEDDIVDAEVVEDESTPVPAQEPLQREGRVIRPADAEEHPLDRLVATGVQKSTLLRDAAELMPVGSRRGVSWADLRDVEIANALLAKYGVDAA